MINDRFKSSYESINSAQILQKVSDPYISGSTTLPSLKFPISLSKTACVSSCRQHRPTLLFNIFFRNMDAEFYVDLKNYKTTLVTKCN
jgi:hypothetical protein